MLAGWPIRGKLLFGLLLVLGMLGILASSSIYGLRSYRRIIKICANRAEELTHVTRLWSATARLLERRPAGDSSPSQRSAVEDLRYRVRKVEQELASYWVKVRHNAERGRVPDDLEDERQVERGMRQHLANLKQQLERAPKDWDPHSDASIQTEVNALLILGTRLPKYLEADLHTVLRHANSVYYSTLWLAAASSVLVVVMLVVLVRSFYTWVFRPIRKLHQGSRRVAEGNFAYRIRLDSHDEMGELAAAFNQMTARFQAIYEDLDRQVRERSRQLIRSERLAGVGFLAAGVAHEINNPLTSIAMASESLQGRLTDSLSQANGEAEIVHKYLRTIQEEAFRCKRITERLLDFSRMGDLQRQPTDLVRLIEDVVEMIRHLGKYRGKRIVFSPSGPVVAPVNPQEIKQVILNLVANALESMDEKGTLTIHVGVRDRMVELAFADDGCGMTPEVLENIFEPFFTRRRSGQGTGLGLSISHRIISQHGGEIEATSPGLRRGSTFTVRLPLEASHRSPELVSEHVRS